MRRTIWVLTFVLAVPALGVISSALLRERLNKGMRAAYAARPEMRPHGFERLTVDGWCGGFTGRTDKVCMEDRTLVMQRVFSLFVGGAGLVWLGASVVAGARARRTPRLLLLAFRPGLYLMAAAVTALILAQGLILLSVLVATRELGMWHKISTLPMIFTWGILIATVGLVVALVRHTRLVMKRPETTVLGRPVSREEAPRLWAAVDTIVARLDALPPDRIVVGVEPSFFVTATRVVTPSGPLTGRTLFCSLSLARILTTRELESVLGHELAHFSGEDAPFSARFYPAHRGAANALRSLRGRTSGRGLLTLLPAIGLFEWFLATLGTAEREWSHERELAADATGARMTDPEATATALVKMHAFAHVWESLRQSALDLRPQGRMFANIGQTYADVVAKAAVPAVLNGVTAQAIGHPTDTHPPLSVRLDALGVRLESVQEAALRTRPSEPASALIDHLDQLDAELGQAYQMARAAPSVAG